MTGLGALYQLAERRATLRRGVKSRVKEATAVPQYSPTPFSSLTAVSDFIANRKYKPKPPNPYTSDEQQLINQLLAGMSRSRARVVDASRRARGDVRSLLASSKLWG